MYLELKINTNKVIEEAKADYYKGQLEGVDAKTIFATLNDLLSRNPRPFPDGDDPKVLFEKFSKFFIDKIQKIRSQLDSAEDEAETVNNPDELQLYSITTSQFCGFNEVSSEKISKLVGSRPKRLVHWIQYQKIKIEIMYASSSTTTSWHCEFITFS